MVQIKIVQLNAPQENPFFYKIVPKLLKLQL
jgi:hypothetical protein